MKRMAHGASGLLAMTCAWMLSGCGQAVLPAAADRREMPATRPAAAQPAAHPAPKSPGLVVREGRFYRDGKPYRGVGGNYYDLFQRVLRRPQDDSSLQGLEALSKAGIPFVRFNAGGYTAQDWRLYLSDKEEFFRRMDLVVRQAERVKVGLIPSMFWTFVLPDLVDEPRDQWGNPDSKTVALMRRFVGDMVTRYKDSPALWAWEFGNELNLAVDLPNAKQFRKKGGTERDDLTSPVMAVMLREFALAVRKHDPHRAVLAGHSHPRFCAWHNTDSRSWGADSREQTLEILRRDNADPLGAISIHLYGGDKDVGETARWASTHAEFLREAKTLARSMNKPLWVGEFTDGIQRERSPEKTRALYEHLLAVLEETEVDLAAFWVFDLPNQPEFSVRPDNALSWVLDLVSQANRRWNAQAARAK